MQALYMNNCTLEDFSVTLSLAVLSMTSQNPVTSVQATSVAALSVVISHFPSHTELEGDGCSVQSTPTTSLSVISSSPPPPEDGSGGVSTISLFVGVGVAVAMLVVITAILITAPVIIVLVYLRKRNDIGHTPLPEDPDTHTSASKNPPTFKMQLVD